MYALRWQSKTNVKCVKWLRLKMKSYLLPVASLMIDNLFSNAFIMLTTKTVIYQASGRELNSKVAQCLILHTYTCIDMIAIYLFGAQVPIKPIRSFLIRN